MEDAVDRYCDATERNDIDAALATLAGDAVLISPISGKMIFRGSEDLRHLLSAVYSSLRDLRWTAKTAGGSTVVVVGEARIGPVRMTDAMVFELASDGRIRSITPHLRPWLALTAFALVLGPKVARRPGVVLRALRS
jgi:hypothetical protein